MTTGGVPIGDLGIVIGETVGAALARIGLGQFDRAAEGMSGLPDRDTGLHEARKALKRLRALLRLVRRDLGEPAFGVHDGALRDLGRAMAPLRDALVSMDTLDAVAPAPCPVLRSSLARRYQRELGGMCDDPAVLRGLLAVVTEGRCRWEAAFPGTLPDGFEVVAGGVARTYRRGRKRMAKAMQRGRDQDYHEWRKETKHLRYQMETLLPLDPGALALPTARLAELGELLGQEHDFSVLIGLVDRADGCDDDRAGLLGMLSTRRARLRDAVHPLGTESFGAKPSALVECLERAWGAGHPA